MKESLRRLLDAVPFRVGMNALSRLDSSSPNLLRVLTYHQVQDANGFEQQIEHIAERFAPVSGEQVIDALLHDAPLPRRALLVTFDDAYSSVGKVAWPILQAYEVPALLFVPSDYVGTARRFWTGRARRRADTVA